MRSHLERRVFPNKQVERLLERRVFPNKQAERFLERLVFPNKQAERLSERRFFQGLEGFELVVDECEANLSRLGAIFCFAPWRASTRRFAHRKHKFVFEYPTRTNQFFFEYPTSVTRMTRHHVDSPFFFEVLERC